MGEEGEELIGDIGIRVSEVRYHGQQKTNYETLSKALSEPLRSCTSLSELEDTINNSLSKRLQKRFKEPLTFKIEVDERQPYRGGPAGGGRAASPSSSSSSSLQSVVVDVFLPPEKNNTIQCRLMANSRFTEPETYLTLRNANLFGNFETLSGQLKLAKGKGWTFPMGYQFKYRKPLSFYPSQSLFLRSDNDTTEDDASHLQTHQLRAGLKLKRSFPSSSSSSSSSTSGGMDSLEYLISSRTLEPKESAPMSVRDSSGFSTKSSVKYSLSRFRQVATGNAELQLTQELAGLGGDARFYKFDFNGSVSRDLLQAITQTNQIFPLISLKATWQMSFVTPFSGRRIRTYDKCFFNDKTMLFFNKTSQDAAGGDYCVAGTLRITTAPRFGGNATFFVNSGSLGFIDKDQTVGKNVQSLKEGLRASFGVGFGNQDVQFLWGFPLRRSRDNTFSWFELRAGTSF